jgi:hypothetical protein
VFVLAAAATIAAAAAIVVVVIVQVVVVVVVVVVVLAVIIIIIIIIIHSFSSLSYDRSNASSYASSPHSAIQSFLLQMRVSSPFLKIIQ